MYGCIERVPVTILGGFSWVRRASGKFRRKAASSERHIGATFREIFVSTPNGQTAFSQSQISCADTVFFCRLCPKDG